jgi:hypothetical protein
MSDLSPLAWGAIILVVIVLVVMNLGLVAFLRYPPDLRKIKMRSSRSAQSWQNMGNFINVLRDPFKDERKQLNELSELVKDLKEPESSDGKGEPKN